MEPETGQRRPPGILGIARKDRRFHRESPGSPSVHVDMGRHRGLEQRCHRQSFGGPVTWQVSRNMPVLKLSVLHLHARSIASAPWSESAGSVPVSGGIGPVEGFCGVGHLQVEEGAAVGELGDAQAL